MLTRLFVLLMTHRASTPVVPAGRLLWSTDQFKWGSSLLTWS